MTDNIKNYPQYTEFQDSDRVKIYSKKNKLAPVSLSLGELKDQIVADAVTNVGYTAPSYTEVNVTSAQILNIGNGVILLPAPGLGNYYSIDKIIMEYTEGTVSYTFSDQLAIQNGTASVALIHSSFINNGNDTSIEVRPNIPATIDGGTYPVIKGRDTENNLAYYLSKVGSSPTDGDGTILVKIWYTIETVGTNL